MLSEPAAKEEFKAAISRHFGPVADRLNLPSATLTDRLFTMSAADIFVRVELFEPFSTAGYNVYVGITPQRDGVRNLAEERGLIWFTEFFGLCAQPTRSLVDGMPEHRIFSVHEIPQRVKELAELTELILGKVFSASHTFWPTFLTFVQTETDKIGAISQRI